MIEIELNLQTREICCVPLFHQWTFTQTSLFYFNLFQLKILHNFCQISLVIFFCIMNEVLLLHILMIIDVL